MRKRLFVVSRNRPRSLTAERNIRYAFMGEKLVGILISRVEAYLADA